MTHFSINAYGVTERNNHSQVHHRQGLQTFHDVWTHNKRVSGIVLDGLLQAEEKEKGFRFRTSRERQQRWLANQDSCRRMVKYATMKDKYVTRPPHTEGHLGHSDNSDTCPFGKNDATVRLQSLQWRVIFAERGMCPNVPNALPCCQCAEACFLLTCSKI